MGEYEQKDEDSRLLLIAYNIIASPIRLVNRISLTANPVGLKFRQTLCVPVPGQREVTGAVDLSQG